MPKVSIIMPVYNGARFLEQAVTSLLEQSFEDLEVIAVDDGSTDGSLRALHHFAELDQRLVVRSRPNSGGPSTPKNEGLDIARGEYVGFLDYDDYSHRDHLLRLVQGLDAHPEWIAAFHDIELVDQSGKPLPGTFLKNLRFTESAGYLLSDVGGNWFECGAGFYEFMSLNFGAIHTQSVLIARNRLAGADIKYDTTYKIVDDTDLWLRLARLGSIGYLDEVLGSYRMHDTNITKRQIVLLKDRLKLHLRNYPVAAERMEPSELARYREKITMLQEELAYTLYREGAHREARVQYDHLLTWEPSAKHRLARLKTYLPSAFAMWVRRKRGT